MSAPYVAGDRDMPEWWGPADEAILRGELAKLADLPRPAVLPTRTPAVPATPAAVDGPPWRMLVALVVALCVVLLGVLVAAAPSSGPAPVVPPTTYGAPGPNGGAFTSMPVAR